MTGKCGICDKEVWNDYNLCYGCLCFATEEQIHGRLEGNAKSICTNAQDENWLAEARLLRTLSAMP